MRSEKLLRIIGEIDMKYITSARNRLEATDAQKDIECKRCIFLRATGCMIIVLAVVALAFFVLKNK